VSTLHVVHYLPLSRLHSAYSNIIALKCSGGKITLGRGGGRGHTCDSVYGRWRQRQQRRGSRPWSSRREETHGSRATPGTPVGARAIVTIAARRGQRAHQTALSRTIDATAHTIRMHKQRVLHSTSLLLYMQAIPMRISRITTVICCRRAQTFLCINTAHFIFL